MPLQWATEMVHRFGQGCGESLAGGIEEPVAGLGAGSLSPLSMHHCHLGLQLRSRLICPEPDNFY